ncbi:ubiquitin carboxyl-terminal hydrolase family protein [Striga asiatica]|uniref:Ubiquitin carboxyl-terminal hydrolase family protein n=1 Tax=Striga asiatica TaxID=4170 RepID=A0A5A7PPZ4_STRAF|nr:ubiquitin carboxyl-terminal hydrolase family protein [Striga asiatica]
MHVAADLNWFLQLAALALAGVFGLLYLVRSTASSYFLEESSFGSSAADYSSLDSEKREDMAVAGGGAAERFNACAVCGLPSTKVCSRCKMIRYCSEACQKSHWNSGHRENCVQQKSSFKDKRKRPTLALRGWRALAIAGGSSNKILFPYEEFVKFFNSDKPGFPPCGLLNCGNSCFANVVLQCLTYTRPLFAYLLEKGHRVECQRDDWCFLCELQLHVERASQSCNPFSPMNILSRLPNIGGNLGYGKQEDAHEFMRFAIDTMQSVCLDEFGGEKIVHPRYQETTLIQHIFGGRLQSQVICAECNNVSNQFENMMDLTVEIHGDAESLEECLDQFTTREKLHGDNMYKCDGCNAYVMAWKRLTIQRAPNILTIALKRFQSGRFGKLNKRVTFPETLDLKLYLSESEDGNDIYKLYAVIVHIDMLNASFFGHYICYIKDLSGDWYRIDDCKVERVDLDEVLSQGAYMLLYSRIRARPSCLLPAELLPKEVSSNVKINEPSEPLADPVCIDSSIDSDQALSVKSENVLPSTIIGTEDHASVDMEIETSQPRSLTVKAIEMNGAEELPILPKEVACQSNPTNITSVNESSTQVGPTNCESLSAVSDLEKVCCGSENGGRSHNSTSVLKENAVFVKKSGEEPTPKLKPLFAPGFLEKGRQRRIVEPLFAPGFLEKGRQRRIVKPENRVSRECFKLNSERALGVAEWRLTPENGTLSNGHKP